MIMTYRKIASWRIGTEATVVFARIERIVHFLASVENGNKVGLLLIGQRQQNGIVSDGWAIKVVTFEEIVHLRG